MSRNEPRQAPLTYDMIHLAKLDEGSRKKFRDFFMDKNKEEYGMRDFSIDLIWAKIQAAITAIGEERVALLEARVTILEARADAGQDQRGENIISHSKFFSLKNQT